MSSSHEFGIDVDRDGIAVVRWKASAATAFVHPETIAAMARTLSHLEADQQICGIVLTADDERFFGGVDLKWLGSITASGDRQGLLDTIESFHRLLSQIEACRKPVAAVIDGDALDGGFDIALACHARFVALHATIRLGFAEARFGLPPIGGGQVRISALSGAAGWSGPVLEGKPLARQAAIDAGLVTAAGESAVNAARDWALAEAARLVQKPAWKANRRTLAPDLSDRLAIAVDEFVAAAFTDVSMSLVATLGLGVDQVNSLLRRPTAVGKRRYRKVGVLGAGLMGAGIALVAARAGMEVVLLDIDRDRARQGLDRISSQERAQAAAGRADPDAVEKSLSLIMPAGDHALLSDADIVVEAVFEDRQVKAEATRLAEAHMRPDAIFATNTSTLPIHGLAQASVRPENFIGTHFFSPVPHMPLLEIISGAATSETTLAAAMDFAQAIGKTPILVNDSRGFYTTRVVMAYQAEAFEMLAEGIGPHLIEQAGRLAGMPVAPLALSDAVGIDLICQINRQTASDLGDRYVETDGYALVGRIVADHGRIGRKAGQGFFDYDDKGRPEGIWDGLAQVVGKAPCSDDPLIDLRDRLLGAQIMETVRCFDEGVISDALEADVGAILGWGFAPWTGGPISYIRRIGVEPFRQRCTELSERYGTRRLTPVDGFDKLMARLQ
ncbi:3-hydroxyacyl-CoA dehydrogenase [Zhengella mangrovi]|uniref:3-hydroxyacyl-CoA dehydrogenase n=1 Tax=Zhengella mangrovi TaxID=1982044 RepID=A0A2G1QGL1_9HYPH|nr:3-hydroxyacyl-CoA dehydrogenase NAD-binding domain-containing protein [Zhengella mangrovi]PHP64601.1 3-hydroxyacyl-CoA dehydrogenase [Zhengella mangrovi]